MCTVLKRGEILIIIDHCLIVLRRDAQKITIIQVHYSRWVGNKKREQGGHLHTVSNTKIGKMKKL